MIRVTVSFKADGDSSAAAALRLIADQLEEGYTAGIFDNQDIEESKYDVETLCEYCNGTGEITQGQHDDIITKKCFNCNGPDYDSQREGK